MGKKIKIKVKKPWIGFCGTPIQQNYAEDLDHGYLLWDISSSLAWDVTFKKLPNPKPYVTIPWRGSIEDLISSASKHPDGTRFRIRSFDILGQKDFSLISESLKNTKLATEVTFKSDFVIDKSIIKTNTTTLEKADLRNADVLFKLINDYYSGTQITVEQWKIVFEQVKSCLSTVILTEELPHNSKWSLRYLSFDNMFAYGEGNMINFDKLNGIVGVFGPNRVGKSSIVGALMYSLFNTTDRGSIKNIHVCNIRKPYCSSKAIINHDGTDYVIERQTVKSESKKGVLSASTALNVFRIKENGEAEDLAGEQRAETEKIIRTLIGNQEDFMTTSLAAQGEMNQFIEQGSMKRRAVLSRFLDLDIFDKMYELSNKELTNYKSQLKNYPDRDWIALIRQYENDIVDVDTKISDSHQLIKDKQQVLSQLQIELSKHKGIPVTKSQVESFAKQLVVLENRCKTCLDSISNLESEINNNSEKLKTIETIKSENDISQLRLQLASLKDLETSLTSLKFIFEKENTLFEQQKKSLKILDEVPCEDNYPTCKFIKDAHINKSKLVDQQREVEQSQKKLEKVKKSFEKLGKENLVNRLEKIEKLLSLETKLLLDISKKEIELEKFKAIYHSQEVELKASREKLTTFEKALKNNDNADAVSIKSNIEDISNIIDALTTDKFDSATRKGKLFANLEKINEEKVARDNLLEKMKVRELVTTAFSKKGLPLIITKSQLPVINIEIAKILHGIVDFTIELENDENTDSSEIYINYGDSRRVIELCSGMEKTIASLALRVAMINISSLSKPNIFVIDEGFGTLDDAAIEACNRLLVSFKKYFKTILIITHIDGVKDVVDHILEITKSEKDSKIVFGVDL